MMATMVVVLDLVYSYYYYSYLPRMVEVTGAGNCKHPQPGQIHDLFCSLFQDLQHLWLSLEELREPAHSYTRASQPKSTM